MAIKKRKPATDTKIVKAPPSNDRMRFSFEFFDASDHELCPAAFPNGYLQRLMARLKELSAWKVREFQTNRSSALRAHTHNWPATSRPDGFAHLNDQHRDYDGWQFCLTANEHGRVHGIIIDNVFYIIWLDVNHALYP